MPWEGPLPGPLLGLMMILKFTEGLAARASVMGDQAPPLLAGYW